MYHCYLIFILALINEKNKFRKLFITLFDGSSISSYKKKPFLFLRRYNKVIIGLEI